MQKLPDVVMNHVCGSNGATSCQAAITSALRTTYQQLEKDNPGKSDVSTWANTTATANQNQTMPQYDAIHFRAIGIVGQPAIDWQNRPTFQQVVEFPDHRPR